MSRVLTDAELVARGRYTVYCSYFDASKAGEHIDGGIDVSPCFLDCERHCSSLEDAKGYIVALRRKAAHSQTVALQSIVVMDALNGREDVWHWAA